MFDLCKVFDLRSTRSALTPEGGSPATQSRTHNKLNEVTQYGGTNVLYDHGAPEPSGQPGREIAGRSGVVEKIGVLNPGRFQT